MARRIDYFSDESLSGDLKGKTVRGGAYTAISQVVQVVVQLGATAFLARLLTPADFGLVAMVTVITNFAAMFVNAGLLIATVQRTNLTREQVTNLFWVATGLACCVAVIVALLAPAVAWFYQEPRLVAITLALTGTFVFAGVTLQPQALLQRGMRFRALATIQIVSMFLAQGVGILYAWYFRSYWALVWIPLVGALTRAVGTWIVCGWRPGLPHRGTSVRTMVSLGAYLTGSNFLNYFSRNLDNMLIGWRWGDTPLGYYDKAYKLLLFPLQTINAPISTVAVPALSRLKDQPERYRNFFRRGVRLTVFAQMPIIIFSFVMAAEIIRMLLGAQWGEVVPIFQALLPAALVSTTAPASVWVYLSWGHTDRLMKAALVGAPIIVTAFVIGLPYGPFGVAVSFSITTCLVRVPNIIYCFRGTPLRLRDMESALWRPFLAATCGGIVVGLVNANLMQGAAVPIRLLVAAGLFCVVYLLCFMVLPGGRQLLREAVDLIQHFQPDKQQAK